MTHPKTLIASLAMLSASVGVQAEGSSYEEITRYISAQCMNVNMGDEPQVTSIDFNQTQVLVRKKMISLICPDLALIVLTCAMLLSI